MAAKTVVAAIAALFAVVSAPASAQNYKCAPCSKGQVCPRYCVPTPPTPPRPTPTPPPQQQRDPQQPHVYPRFRVCVVPGVGSCEAFRDPGSYCECRNNFGCAFSDTVQ